MEVFIVKLINMINDKDKITVAPLVGYPGAKLTKSRIVENLKCAKVQFETINEIIKNYNPDVVFPFMDLSIEAETLGLDVEFPEKESPNVREHPVKNENHLDRLKKIKVTEGRKAVFTDVIKRLKKETNKKVGGYVISPFTLAGLLMGAQNLAVNTIMNNKLCHQVLAFALKTIIPYARAQQQAGADFIVLLEPTAVLLSPELFDDFVVPYVTDMTEKLDVPVVLHVCGNSTDLVPLMCKTGVQGLSLDSPVDFLDISKDVPEDIVLIGNLSPVDVLLNMDYKGVYHETVKFLKSTSHMQNLILSTGCDLPPETPLENVSAFMQAAVDFNKAAAISCKSFSN